MSRPSLRRAFRTGIGKARKDFFLIMALTIPTKDLMAIFRLIAFDNRAVAYSKSTQAYRSNECPARITHMQSRQPIRARLWSLREARIPRITKGS